MPRRSKRPKTLSGVPGAPPVPPVDVPYGEGERMIESQRRTPVPDYSAGGGSAAEVSTGAPAGPGAPVDRLQAAMEAAQGMAPPTNLLTAPTNRPGEPITAGLPVGAGPGPEVLASGDRAVRTLRMLADVTADAGFSELAELAARQIRR